MGFLVSYSRLPHNSQSKTFFYIIFHRNLTGGNSSSTIYHCSYLQLFLITFLEFNVAVYNGVGVLFMHEDTYAS